MSYEMIALLMFSSMMVMLLTGQRVLEQLVLSVLYFPSFYGETEAQKCLLMRRSC